MGTASISSVGDHFIIGLRPSVELDPRDRALLSELKPAGVILYKSNFLHDQPYERWLAAHAKLIAAVRAAVGRERLLIAIDHEGGRVCRTPPPVTRFSYACDWAATARDVGRAMGTELASLGINLNFAPVLDIHSNPANPVIGARAFGSAEQTVIDAALAFMSAMQAERVLACGKHFPGHGDTDKDSHRELPVLHQGLEELLARELKPFVAAIKARIPILMTGHILVPALDAKVPVTLSRRFNQELLRDQLGFDGVIVSDDIGMHAVSALFDDPANMVNFMRAGADLLMVCSFLTDTDRCRALAQALVRARDDDRGVAGLIAKSRTRIEGLLNAAPQNTVCVLDASRFQEHQSAGAIFKAATVEVV